MTRPTHRLAPLGLAATLALAPLVAMPRPAAAAGGPGRATPGPTPTTPGGPGRAAVTPDYIPGMGWPPCYGASCVGEDPTMTNPQGVSCADTAVDLATVRSASDGYSVTLRWSNWCHANWTRWPSDTPSSASSGFFTRTSDGHVEWSRGYYTYMVNGYETAQACIIPYSPPHTPICSGWY
jgi:hypothetical protein